MRFLATADWHFRDDQPACRLDNLLETLIDKANEVVDIAHEEGVSSIIIAGDVFHKWKSSPFLIRTVLEEFVSHIEIHAIPGQHDLPSHRLSEYEKSALAVLESAKNMRVHTEVETCASITYVPYGEKPSSSMEPTVLVMHRFAYDGNKPFPGVPKEALAKNILKKHEGHDIIITGDNHQSFSATYKGRVLVNPGSLTRQTADQVDHHPSVCIVDTEKPTEVEWIELSHSDADEVLSREHIDRKQEKQERVEAFVSKLGGDVDWSISFESNMKAFLAENSIEKEAEELIAEYMEEE